MGGQYPSDTCPKIRRKARLLLAPRTTSTVEQTMASLPTTWTFSKWPHISTAVGKYPIILTICIQIVATPSTTSETAFQARTNKERMPTNRPLNTTTATAEKVGLLLTWLATTIYIPARPCMKYIITGLSVKRKPMCYMNSLRQLKAVRAGNPYRTNRNDRRVQELLLQALRA